MRNQKSEQRAVKCERQIIEYVLTRKSVKNINLRIKTDGTVLVSANAAVPAKYIDKLIKEKQFFIIKAQNKFKEKKPVKISSRQYINGESYHILGEERRLKLLAGTKEEVFYKEGILFLIVKDTDDFARKEQLIQQWMKLSQRDTFEEICQKIYPLVQSYGVTYPEIKIRSMTSRWGSCRPQKNSITLNSRLIEVPYCCIEYVVLHEFAHFIHPNHSKQFYDFVEMLMPDWKQRKEKLSAWQ